MLCVVKFIAINKDMYVNDEDPIFNEIRTRVAKINPSLAKIPLKHSKKTYIIDKSVIYLCTNDINGNSYDMDTIMIAYIHELAHAISKSVGHDSEFLKNNETLLSCGHNAGILNKNHVMPKLYCGVKNE